MEVTLDSLTEQLRATSADVGNVTNQFLCLSDTQFLENRVYDDDDNEDDGDKEMPSEEKREEAKVRAVILRYNVSHQLICYRNILTLSLHQVVMKTEQKKVLKINVLHVYA
jgi:hypothetical protein